MALALFAKIHGTDNLILGPTHTGRDGGNDGWYDGEIGGLRARWKIACAVRKSPSSLLTKARNENKTGARAGAEAILLLTPLNLNVDQVRKIEVALGKGLRRGLVWPRSMLEYHLHNDRLFAADYFGLQLIPGFVRLDSPIEPELTKQKDLPLVGREDALREVEGFLQGSDRVLLIIAPGGSGKSRFLRELASVSSRVAGRSAWLRLSGQGTLEEALTGGMPRNTPLLLCLDDAMSTISDDENLATSEPAELARLAMLRLGGLDVKVLLSARPADTFQVERACRSVNVSIRTLRLEPLAQAHTERILAEDCPGLPPFSIGALIRFSGGNIFVLRAAAQAIARGERVFDRANNGDLRGLIVERLIREATEALRPANRVQDATERILLMAALDAPIPREFAEADEHLAALIAAKILRIVGYGTRFRVDVEADLLLGHLLQFPWAQALLQQQLAQAPERLPHRLRNLTMASLAMGGEGHSALVVEQVCQAWVANASRTSAFARRAILKALPHAAIVAPQAATDLCRRYLTALPAPPIDGKERALGYPLTTDELAPVIIALAGNHHPVHALQLALDACAAGVSNGQFDNYKLPNINYEYAGVITEVVSPVYNDPATLRPLLTRVEAWLLDETGLQHKAGIITAVFETLLAKTFSWTTSEPTTYTHHESHFAATPEVLALRGHALTVLEHMFEHEDSVIRLAAARIFAKHGRPPMMIAEDSDIDSILEAEIVRLLPHIEQRLDVESDFEVLSEIERALTMRWASQRSHGEACGALLRGRRRTPLYRAYQLVENKVLNWRFDPDELWNSAPATDRWHWWITLKTNAMFAERGVDLMPLIEALRSQTSDASSLAIAIRAIGIREQIFFILDPWYQRSQSLFHALCDTPGLEPALQRVIGRVIRRAEYRDNPARVLSDLEACIANSDLPEIRELIGDGGLPPIDTRLAVIGLLVSDPRVTVRAYGLDRLALDASASIEQTVALLTKALRDGNWRRHWEVVWHFVSHDIIREKIASSDIALILVERRLKEALAGETIDDTHLTDYCLTDSVNKLHEISASRLTFVEDSLAVAGMSARKIGPLLAPMLRDGQQLEAMALALMRWLEDGRLANVSEAIDLLHTGLKDDLPAEALELGRRLLKDDSAQARVVGVILLSELRGSAEACVEVAEAYVGRDPIASTAAARAIANFHQPRGAFMWTPGEIVAVFAQIARTLKAAEEIARSIEARTVIIEMENIVADHVSLYARHGEEQLDPHRS